MQRVAYGGWSNCVRLANKAAELVVTADVGPRVIRFALTGGAAGANVFKEYPDMLGKTGGDEWRIFGGHRLWHAPEAQPRSYVPDNGPVKIEPLAGSKAGLRAIQPTEGPTGIQKEMDVELLGDGPAAAAKVTHRLRNNSAWPITLAPWALSVMAQGGTAVLPLPPSGEHTANLTPSGMLGLWAYTDLSDPRWTIGRRAILLRQDSAAKTPQKIGLFVPDGWAAYIRDGVMFLKTFRVADCGTYPDFGCNAETYTNADMLELESVGPLSTLPPGGVVEHVENWFLVPNVPTPTGDADVIAKVVPAVAKATGK
jgi:hypothetical protein